MNCRTNSRSRIQGSALIVTLWVIVIVLFVILPSILLITASQNLSVARSQSWNAAIAMAEAGVEEVLAHLNPAAFRTNAPREANGWTFSDGFYRTARRTLKGGYYDAVFTDDSLPVIYSTGYVTVPLSSVPVARVIKVTTTNSSAFMTSMAAQTTIDFKGFNVETDSYDSTDPLKSTNGKYDPLKAGDHGDVATNSGITNYLNAGNGKIKGKLRTGPFGYPKLGPNGSVGSAAWVDGGSTGIEPGWFKDDMNLEFLDVLAPYSSGTTPVGGNVNGTNYTYVLGNDNYILNTLNLKNLDTMTVQAGATATLYVTGNVLMQGGSSIYIAPGATLKIYVGGSDATFTKVNTTGAAISFQYYGLPTNTSLTWNGNAEYLGTIYAPSTAFKIGGGGNDVYDFQGSCMVYSIFMNGHFRFHFDESLLKAPISLGLVASSWNEL